MNQSYQGCLERNLFKSQPQTFQFTASSVAASHARSDQKSEEKNNGELGFYQSSNGIHFSHLFPLTCEGGRRREVSSHNKPYLLIFTSLCFLILQSCSSTVVQSCQPITTGWVFRNFNPCYDLTSPSTLLFLSFFFQLLVGLYRPIYSLFQISLSKHLESCVASQAIPKKET